MMNNFYSWRIPFLLASSLIWIEFFPAPCLADSCPNVLFIAIDDLND